MPNDNFNSYCESLLVEYNRRNTQATRRRIDELCNILRRNGNHVVQPMFGGSVNRGTDVNGISDVDVLLIVNQSSLANQQPAEVIAYVRDTINRQMFFNTVRKVRKGNLAVTVEYPDDAEIQILPAIRRDSGGVRIAQPGSTGWSNTVQLERFAEQLRRVNQAKGSRVIPVIMLAKALADCFIKKRDNKIRGYHMEALAIDAFRNYQGDLGSKSMLIHLLGCSITAVMRPIADATGQSRFVDGYLGSVEFPGNADVRQPTSGRCAERSGVASQEHSSTSCSASTETGIS